MTAARPIPQAVVVFLTPVVALVLAALYMQVQVQRAQEAAAALCAQFKPGDSVAAFKQAALQSNFSLSDNGPTGLTVIASKVVYRIEQESYRCNATHDGATLLSLKTSVARE